MFFGGILVARNIGACGYRRRASPRIRSLRPTPYTQAVSKKLHPREIAAPSDASDSSSSEPVQPPMPHMP
jgi:hypothetical protein